MLLTVPKHLALSILSLNAGEPYIREDRAMEPGVSSVEISDDGQESECLTLEIDENEANLKSLAQMISQEAGGRSALTINVRDDTGRSRSVTSAKNEAEEYAAVLQALRNAGSDRGLRDCNDG